MTTESPQHPFPQLYESSKQGGGLYLGQSIWREAVMENVQSVKELYIACMKFGIRLQDHPVLNDAKISRSRNRAASAFLESKCDVFVTVDGDIEFHPGDLLRIAEEAYEHGLVGGAYTKRNGIKTELAIRVPDGEYTFADDGKLAPIDYLSTGFLAVHRRVFEDIIREFGMEPSHQSNLKFYPFFNDYIYEKDGGERFDLSEDWAFCQRAKDVGYQCWLDPRVRLAHFGYYGYTLEDLLRPDRPPVQPFVYKKEAGKVSIGVQQDTLTQTADGFMMALDPNDMMISESIRRTGYWDKPVRDAIVANLKPGWTFLDLGAHLGYFSLLAASRGAKVIAIEPQPEMVRKLRLSAAANQFEINVQQIAVGVENRMAKLKTTGLQNNGEVHLSPDGEIDAQVVTLPEILGSVQPKFIKIDIEDSDLQVITANPEIFSAVNVVIFETRPRSEGESAMLAFFIEHGFEVSQLHTRSAYSDWLAIKVPEPVAD